MIRKPKILFVLSDKLGWRTHSSQLQKVLAERDDLQWEVLAFTGSSWRRALLKRHNMSRMDRLLRHIDPIKAYRGPLGQPVRAAADRFVPDLVHFGGPLPAGGLLSRSGAPAFTVGLDATRANMNGFRHSPVWNMGDLQREAELLRSAIALFPWSRWAGESAINDYGVPPGRVTVVPPSIDPTTVGTSRSKEGGKLPKIVFIGNHLRRKGGDLLHRWVTGPLAGLCELHLVSGDPAAKNLEGSNIVVHGSIAHRHLMTEILPRMDLLCHPTQRDMSAYVVVEAAFAGLPAVASDVGGIPELIVDGRTGWVLGRSDEAGFIRTLTELLTSPDRVTEAGMQARLHAARHFDADRNYNAMIDRLKTLVQEVA